MPDILCSDARDDNNIRSVVLVTINGTEACTGTLLNTTSDDNEQVLLTAVHCLNNNFEKPNVDYAKVAGTIVCFFNYRKPFCNQDESAIRRMKGTEEMSVAGTQILTLAIKNDMALLKLKDIPPDYYQHYYDGWDSNVNVGANAPFVNIHHPNGYVSKYGITIKNLVIGSFPDVPFFNSGVHWRVSSWDEGSTAAGSSGSPLFNNKGLLVGGLSGGSSFCDKGFPNGKPDYFFALYKSWTYIPNFGIPLKSALDPKDSGVRHLAGYDPNNENPFFRLNNGATYGDADLNIKEFTTGKSVEFVGVNLLMPPMPTATLSLIRIKVYKNAFSEENLVASELIRPTYLAYDTSSGTFVERDKMTGIVATETFVKFPKDVVVGTKFYVSYGVENSSTFVPAALAVEPLVRYKDDLGLQSLRVNEKQIVYLKESQQLQIKTNNPCEKGTILIYSITGQLLCKTFYKESNPVDVSSIGNNNIVVVKVLSENGVKAAKIIL
jgi:hypothetical protein